jgi:hypothetical protein
MSRNSIWDYFTKSENDASKAHCVECSKLLSFGSDKPGKQTVHGLKARLKSHKEQNAAYLQKVEDSDQNKIEPPAKKAKLDMTPISTELTLPSLAQR